MQLVIVHRYSNPDAFGLHRKDNEEQTFFDTIGLYSPERLAERLAAYGELQQQDVTSVEREQLLGCAPVEWHSELRNGQLLDRFQVFNAPSAEPVVAPPAIDFDEGDDTVF